MIFSETFWKGCLFGGIGAGVALVFGCVTALFDTDAAGSVFCFGILGLGLLGFVIGVVMSIKSVEKKQRLALRKVEKECRRSKLDLHVIDEFFMQVSGRKVGVGEKLSQSLQARLGGGVARIDTVQSIHIGCSDGDFHLVIPWSGADMMAVEFLSVMRGYLPAPLGLARSEIFGLSTGGTWIGPDGVERHPIAAMAQRHEKRAGWECLQEDIEWDWYKGNLKSKLDWGLQAAPLSASHYVHIIHTAQLGWFFKRFGLDWYIDRRLCFAGFVADLKLDRPQVCGFLLPCESLNVLDGMKIEEGPDAGRAQTEAPIPVRAVDEGVVELQEDQIVQVSPAIRPEERIKPDQKQGAKPPARDDDSEPPVLKPAD